MAGGFLINGRKYYKAGVYSSQDASALAGKAPGARGIIGVLLETSKGGVPGVVNLVTNPAVILRDYPEPLATYLSNIAFNPSSDPKVPNGAVALAIVRVNQSTQGQRTFSNGDGGALLLTSADYGVEANDILATIAAGTNYGRKVTIRKGTTTQTIDDKAYSYDVLQARYQGEETGLDYMKCAVDPATGVVITYKVTKTAGTYTPSMMAFDGAVTFTIGVQGADRTMTITGTLKTAYGAAAAGSPATENVVISAGGTTGTSLREWATITSIVIDAGLVGNCEITGDAFNLPVSTYDTVTKVIDRINTFSAQGFYAAKLVGTAFNVEDLDKESATDIHAKLQVPGNQVYNPSSDNLAFDGTIRFTLVSAQATDKTIAIVGTDYYGDAQSESVVIPAGETEAETTGVWNTVTSITLPVLTGLDVVIEADGHKHEANLYKLIYEIGQSITLVEASRVSGATGLPNNGSGLLTGGSDGTASASDWRDGYTPLKQVDCSHVLPLSTASYQKTYLANHLSEMEALGRPRMGLLGIPTATKKADLKAAIIDCNNRNIVACAQTPYTTNHLGEEVAVGPEYQALWAAAMDCGRKQEWSLIWTVPNMLDFDDNPDDGTDPWDTENDRDELIQAGLFMVFSDAGIIKWETDATTYVTDDNPIYCSFYANESLNLSVRNLNTALQAAIGRGNFVATTSIVTEIAKSELARQVREKEIKAYQPNTVKVTDLGNGFSVVAKVAPVEATRFIDAKTYVERMPTTV